MVLSSAKHSQVVPAVREIMLAFSHRTGLADSSISLQRYLWTDAFAVCNFLELYRQSGEQEFLASALRLVERVHLTLGKFSTADPRSGWISGLGENEGRRHPTRGGLRIGKNLAERKPDEAFDQRLEWDRDGQYFHYLTKWMYALSQVSEFTGDQKYHRWALELAKVSHGGFIDTVPGGGVKRMYWKMSVDLSRPLVTGMSHHDPLDGLITYLHLRATGRRLGRSQDDICLEREIADCQAMCTAQRWVTQDPLSIGSLLVNAYRLSQFMVGGNSTVPLSLTSLLVDCEIGLHAFARSGLHTHAVQHRLAFRELGLAIGLHALTRLRDLTEQNPDSFARLESLPLLLARLAEFAYLAEEIETFWLRAANQQSPSWSSHVDINAVMLATSLAPDGFLLTQ